MRIYAFQGITYAPGAGDPGVLAAPPYDQIGEDAAVRLHALDPHHFAWLSRPEPGEGGEAGDRYCEAARLHAAWLDEGILARAAKPTLYPYSIDLPDGRRRLGLLARMRDVLPGRYTFGLTGRDARGRPLAHGHYAIQVVAVPVAGGRPTRRTRPFALR